MRFSTLLVSCYELGHQPLSLAWPLAALRAAGLDADTVDLAVEEFPTHRAARADLFAIAVPMHTALRVGVEAARQARAANPGAHLCFFGLYAWLNRDYLLKEGEGGSQAIADSVVAGETELVLVELAQRLSTAQPPIAVAGLTTRERAASPSLARLTLPLPDRSTLPPLDNYAHYVEGPLAAENGNEPVAVRAGYVEASRGCLHKCRHCPVVPVYNGRFFVVPVETVMADITQQVEAGARHITFGDPDFLNGPGHARKVAHALHTAFPGVSFDFTAKVEHLLKHRALLPELVACGASFAVSAFESTSDRVLARLQKGHTRRQMEELIAVLGETGLSVQPTWMPFTPWTGLNDYLFMLRWIREQGLIPHVPPVQLSIRMLVPPQSALLEDDDAATWRGALDSPNFTFRWHHPDPRMDALQQEVARIAEIAGRHEAASQSNDSSETAVQSDPAAYGEDFDPFEVFRHVERTAYRFAGRPAPDWPLPSSRVPQPPRLTEHWFC